MFSSLSWKDFTIGMMILIVLYYVVIFLLYYRSELQYILSHALNSPGKLSFSGAHLRQDSGSKEVEQPAVQEVSTPKGKDKSDSAEDFNQLLEQIQQGISHAAQEKMVKQELLWMIRSLLQQYHHLRNTDNIIAINDFVIQVAEDQCGISLGLDDLSPLWN